MPKSRLANADWAVAGFAAGEADGHRPDQQVTPVQFQKIMMLPRSFDAELRAP